MTTLTIRDYARETIERAARALALFVFDGGIRLAVAIAEWGHAGSVASDLDHLRRHGRGRYTGGRTFYAADLPMVETARRRSVTLEEAPEGCE